MKKILLSLALAISLVSCQQQPTNYSYQQPVQSAEPQVAVQPANQNIGDNLDLQALGDLVKQSPNAEAIERTLNSSGSINNLDLDGDGQVDYIKVNEVTNGGTRGFEFLVDTNGTPQQVAVVNLQQTGGVVVVNVQGNRDYYGPQSYYSSTHALRDLMIMNYLFSYHRPYYSPYHYGYYPSHYRAYRSVPYHSYRNSRVVTRTTTRTYTRPSATKTYKNSYGNTYKSRPVTAASERTRNMARPTTSQKSFRVTSPSASRPSTSGFGNNKSSYGNSSYKSSRPSSSYGSSSYGSSRKSSSSYGSSRKSSSSSSFGSSRSSSRSSSFGSSSRSSSRRR